MSSILDFVKDAWPAITGGVAFVATVLGFREYILLPRTARQELLDRLPDPKQKGWDDMKQTASLDDQKDFVLRNGVDLATLNSKLASSERYIYRALRKLVAQRKVEIFIQRGVVTEPHPAFPPGAVHVLPILFKGALPPALRPSDAELKKLLDHLW